MVKCVKRLPFQMLIGFSHEIAKNGKRYLNSSCKQLQAVIESWQWKLLWACKTVERATRQWECLSKVLSNMQYWSVAFFLGEVKVLISKQNNLFCKRFFSFLRRATNWAIWSTDSGDAQQYAHVKKVQIFPIFTKIDIIFAFPLFFLKEILVNILPYRSLTKRHSTGKVLRLN